MLQLLFLISINEMGWWYQVCFSIAYSCDCAQCVQYAYLRKYNKSKQNVSKTNRVFITFGSKLHLESTMVVLTFFRLAFQNHILDAGPPVVVPTLFSHSSEDHIYKNISRILTKPPFDITCIWSFQTYQHRKFVQLCWNCLSYYNIVFKFAKQYYW